MRHPQPRRRGVPGWRRGPGLSRELGQVLTAEGDPDHVRSERVAGTTATELGRRYGVAKSSVVRLIRQADKQVRHARFSRSGSRFRKFFKALPQQDLLYGAELFNSTGFDGF
jgi:hypothetical protein